MYFAIEIGEGRMTGGIWASVTAACQAAITIAARPIGRPVLRSLLRPLSLDTNRPAMMAPVSVPMPVEGSPVVAMFALTRSRCRALQRWRPAKADRHAPARLSGAAAGTP